MVTTRRPSPLALYKRLVRIRSAGRPTPCPLLSKHDSGECRHCSGSRYGSAPPAVQLPAPFQSCNTIEITFTTTSLNIHSTSFNTASFNTGECLMPVASFRDLGSQELILTVGWVWLRPGGHPPWHYTRDCYGSAPPAVQPLAPFSPNTTWASAGIVQGAGTDPLRRPSSSLHRFHKQKKNIGECQMSYGGRVSPATRGLT